MTPQTDKPKRLIITATRAGILRELDIDGRHLDHFSGFGNRMKPWSKIRDVKGNKIDISVKNTDFSWLINNHLRDHAKGVDVAPLHYAYWLSQAGKDLLNTIEGP